jgi:hypothetical protein
MTLMERIPHSRAMRTDRPPTCRFDAEQMEGNIVDQMVAGIEDSAVVVCFVTERYMKKVAQVENPNDNCKLEFMYALKRKTVKGIVPVVMETRMLNQSNWTGPIGMSMNTQLYVSLTDRGDDISKKVIEELVSKIKRAKAAMTGSTNRGQADTSAAQKREHAPPAAPPAAERATAVSAGSSLARDLQEKLEAEGLEGCCRALSDFGVHSWADFTSLVPTDFDTMGLKVLQARKLKELLARPRC